MTSDVTFDSIIQKLPLNCKLGAKCINNFGQTYTKYSGWITTDSTAILKDDMSENDCLKSC